MLCVIRFFGHIEHNWYALNKNNKNFFRWLHIILVIKKCIILKIVIKIFGKILKV